MDMNELLGGHQLALMRLSRTPAGECRLVAEARVDRFAASIVRLRGELGVATY